MSYKIVLVCAQICLIKTALTQCLGPKPACMDIPRLGNPGRFESALLLESYPMPTPGFSVLADDLLIEGMVTVSGKLPFLGTVAIEGAVPTEGSGSVMYGCGNGEVGIMGENPAYGPFAGPMPGYAGPMPGFSGPMTGFAGPRGLPLGPTIDPGMTSVGLGAAANAAGLTARAGF